MRIHVQNINVILNVFLEKIYQFMYLNVLLECVDVYHECATPARPEEAVTRATGGCELLCGFWVLARAAVLLIHERALQPQ